MPSSTANAMKLRRFGTSMTSTSQRLSSVKLSREEEISKLLNRKWMLHAPDTKIHQIRIRERPSRGFSFSNTNMPPFWKGVGEPAFYVVRDDLLHPLVNGNKLRKLDALLPLLQDCNVTDVVTCGGCQSAHAAAVAVSCAERGLKSHLLLRGEQPKVLTGYNLISTIYGEVTYVPRSIYAHRGNLLMSHANYVAGKTGHVLSCNDILDTPSVNKSEVAPSFGEISASTSSANCMSKVVIINEGAGDVVAFVGVIRLVNYLCKDHLLGTERPVRLVVDAGTGTTAIGLGVAALCLRLPWKVTAVMLADTVDAYKKKEKDLLSEFAMKYGLFHSLDQLDRGVVDWVDRQCQRKFGNVLEGEIERCCEIARQTGVLVDPVYTLAAWETSMQLSMEEMGEDTKVVMLHTGGTLGMFGLAQRYSTFFDKLKLECPQ